jgi:NAD(P)H-flavin reductase
MVQRLLEQLQHGQVWLLAGARLREGLLYDADWRALSRQHEGFHYMPTLTRPHSWSGSTGRVQTVLPGLLETLPRPTQTTAYLCGFPEMLEDARPLLRSAGVPDARIVDKQY